MIFQSSVSSSDSLTLALSLSLSLLLQLISAGILVAFSMTNTCLVLLRCSSPVHHSNLLEILLAIYNGLCFITAMLWSHTWAFLPFQRFSAVLSTIATVGCLIYMAIHCPKTAHFGGSIFHGGEYHDERHITHESSTENDTLSNGVEEGDYFQTPCVPFLPCKLLLYSASASTCLR